jgi:hypothetical protein
LRGSLRRLRESYLRWRGQVTPTKAVRRRRASNRISAELELEILRLHVAHPHLGAARLRGIVHRVLGRLFARETIRAVLLRNGPAIVAATPTTFFEGRLTWWFR